MRLEERLQRYFDLTLYEARAYLTLLMRGSLRPKEVAEYSGIPLPRVYDTLSSLKSKGFAEEVTGNYRAVPPHLSLRNALLRFQAEFERQQDERRMVMEEVLASLRGFEPPPLTEVVLLRGLNSIVSRLLEVVEESPELFFLIRKALRVKPLFRSALAGSGLQGKRVRVLLPEGVELEEEDISLIRELNIHVRFAKFTLLDILVGGGKYVMIGVPERDDQGAFSAVAVWIRNESFASSLLESLEELWRIARPMAGAL